MENKKRNFWISAFQRNGQRFLCSSCGYAGEFNAFRLDIKTYNPEVRFICPSCRTDLVFDPEFEAMRPGHGEMIYREASFSNRSQWVRMRQVLLVGSGLVLFILVLVYVQFARLGTRMEGLDAHVYALSVAESQHSGSGRPVDLSVPEFQEIEAGYAIRPRSAVRESSGVRIKGVVVNEKAFAVDAKFRLSQAEHSQTFLVVDLASGKGEPFEVLVPGATEASGKVLVEVVKTSLNFE